VRLTVYVSDLRRFAPMVDEVQAELWGKPPYPLRRYGLAPPPVGTEKIARSSVRQETAALRDFSPACVRGPIAGLRVGVSLGTSDSCLAREDDEPFRSHDGSDNGFRFPKSNDGWLDSILRHYWRDRFGHDHAKLYPGRSSKTHVSASYRRGAYSASCRPESQLDCALLGAIAIKRLLMSMGDIYKVADFKLQSTISPPTQFPSQNIQ